MAPQFGKAKIRNLRSQSPFERGVRNSDFVNPSLVSNLVFYNYGKEKVRNPHRPPQTHKTNGYNLNDYVVTQPVGAERQSSKYSQKREKTREKVHNGSRVVRSQRSTSRLRKSVSKKSLSKVEY